MAKGSVPDSMFLVLHFAVQNRMSPQNALTEKRVRLGSEDYKDHVRCAHTAKAASPDVPRCKGTDPRCPLFARALTPKVPLS